MVDIPLRVVGTFDDSRLNAGLNRMQGKVAGIGNLMKTAFGAWISIQGLRMLGRAISSTTDYQNALKGLDTQTRVVGASSRELLRSLQDVTEGQISLADLTVSSNKAIALLGTDAIPQFKELAEVAAKASTVMGISVTQAFDDIVTGIGRQSRMILDNLGIIVSTTEAYKAFADQIGKTADQLTEAEKKQAFLNATLTQAKEKYGDLAVEVNPMQQLAAALANVGTALLGVFTPDIGTGLTGLTEALNDLGEWVKTHGNEIKSALVGISAIAGMLVIMKIAAWLVAIRIALSPLLMLMDDFLMTIDALGMKAAIFGTLLPGLLTPITLITAAVIAVAVGFTYWNYVLAETEGELRKVREETEKTLQSQVDFRDELYRITNALQEATGASGEQSEAFRFLKGRIIALISEFPDFADELRISVDWQGNLRDVGYEVIDSLDELQAIFNTFDTTSYVDQMNQAIEADRRKLFEAQRAEFMHPGGVGEALGQTGYYLQQMWRQFLGVGEGPILSYEAFREQEWEQFVRENFPRILQPTGPLGGGLDIEEIIAAGPPDVGEGPTPKEAFLEAMTAMKGERWFEELFRRWTEALEQMADSVTRVVGEPYAVGKPKLSWEERLKARGWESMAEYEAAKKGERDKRDKDEAEKMETVFDRFINNLADTLGKFLENWGWKGGELDAMGLLRNIVSPITKEWGGKMAGWAGMGTQFGGPMGGLIGGGIGFLANKIFGGDKPLEIEQPIDIRIVDIETRLMNFFNFRGMDPFTYSSSFRAAFEGGLY